MRRPMRPIRRRGELGDLQNAAAQLQQLAANVGFSGDDLATAVAIALAESGGNPNATGDNGTSYGLWQIHWTVHPEFDKTRLFDPQYNANAAYSIYSRRGSFADWTTYKTGAYVQFLPSVPPLTLTPLTIDAGTSQPIADSTPTPDFSVAQAAVFSSPAPSPSLGVLIGVGAAAIGLYVLMEDVLS